MVLLLSGNRIKLHFKICSWKEINIMYIYNQILKFQMLSLLTGDRIKLHFKILFEKEINIIQLNNPISKTFFFINWGSYKTAFWNSHLKRNKFYATKYLLKIKKSDDSMDTKDCISDKRIHFCSLNLIPLKADLYLTLRSKNWCIWWNNSVE